MQSPNKNDSTNKRAQIREEYETRGISGLSNLGNTCYMNSALQVLSATDVLVSYLQNDQFKNHIEQAIIDNLYNEHEKSNNADEPLTIDEKKMKFKRNQTLTYKLHTLFKYMWSENCLIRPVDFKKAIDKKSHFFFGTKQQDSQEFLTFLLDRIHEETKTDVSISSKLDSKTEKFAEIVDDLEEQIENKIGDIESNKTKLLEFRKLNPREDLISKSVKSWNNILNENYSVIIDIFSALTLTTVHCKKCDYDFHRFDRSDILTLCCPEDKSEVNIEDLFDQYVSTEEMVEKNQFQCDVCQDKQDAESTTQVWHQPERLIIMFKKYKNIGGRLVKNNVKVNYKHTLDMKPYVSKYWKEGNEYELYAAIRHSGGMGGGHYIAYSKNPINGKWFICDDSRVYATDEDDVLKSNSYVLFYEKKTNYRD